MSSVELFREFVNERLISTAEEIFGVFQKTIVEYEEEIDRQRKLLDIVWIPEIKLHRIELPQQHVCIKEGAVLADQQLCIQERNSSLDQEDPEPPQMKEEHEDLCTSQEEEQSELKQETETFMLSPTYEESDHSDKTLYLNPDQSAEKETVVNTQVKSCVVSEQKSDHQLLAHKSTLAQYQDQKVGEYGDSGSPKDSEPTGKSKQHKSKRHSNNIFNPTRSQIHCNTHTDNQSFKCDTCGKEFKFKSQLLIHVRTHTGEKLYCCSTCGKRFSTKSYLNIHARLHTGEKPYRCKNCSSSFISRQGLTKHTRIHTGERPFTCDTCGKDFRQRCGLTDHIRRVHTGEKPYICKTCGKRFIYLSVLTMHTGIHTGEKPYTCKTCGKDFRLNRDLTIHVRRAHTGEKPYLCKTCGKGFIVKAFLKKHMRIHTSHTASP